MFKVQELREIIKLVDNSSIDEFVYENDGAKINRDKSASIKKRKKRCVTWMIARFEMQWGSLRQESLLLRLP